MRLTEQSAQNAVLFIDAVPIRPEYSGTRTRLVELYRAYARRYSWPRLVIAVDERSPAVDALRAAPVDVVASKKPSRGYRLLRATRRLRALADRYGAAAVQLEAPPIPLRLDRPVILSLHDTRAFVASRGELGLRGLYQRIALPRLASRVDGILALTTHAAEEVRTRLGVERRSIAVVPAGVAPPTHSTAALRRAFEAVSMRFPALGREDYVLSVGHLEPRKNLGVLIEAARRFRIATGRDLPVVLAGADAGCGERLRALAAADPPIDLVLPGPVDEDTKWALVEYAKCVVVPSVVEGFGIAAIEAMAVGTPVVASDTGVFREVVGDAGWLCPPADPEAFAIALRDVGSDSASDRLRRGIERAARYSWDRSAELLHAAYTRFLGSRVP